MCLVGWRGEDKGASFAIVFQSSDSHIALVFSKNTETGP